MLPSRCQPLPCFEFRTAPASFSSPWRRKGLHRARNKQPLTPVALSASNRPCGLQRQAPRSFLYLPCLARQSLRCSWLLPWAQPAPSCAPLHQSTTAACQMAAWASPPAGGQWTSCVMPVARATCWHMEAPRTPSAVSMLRAQQLQKQHQRHSCKSIHRCQPVTVCAAVHAAALPHELTLCSLLPSAECAPGWAGKGNNGVCMQCPPGTQVAAGGPIALSQCLSCPETTVWSVEVQGEYLLVSCAVMLTQAFLLHTPRVPASSTTRKCTAHGPLLHWLLTHANQPPPSLPALPACRLPVPRWHPVQQGRQRQVHRLEARVLQALQRQAGVHGPQHACTQGVQALRRWPGAQHRAHRVR